MGRVSNGCMKDYTSEKEIQLLTPGNTESQAGNALLSWSSLTNVYGVKIPPLNIDFFKIPGKEST